MKATVVALEQLRDKNLMRGHARARGSGRWRRPDMEGKIKIKLVRSPHLHAGKA